MSVRSASPAVVPVLSRGKHRSPRKGACFMEMAAYLAGERWSDHPTCTHPLLASLARQVNDLTSDTHRARLAPLIPSVIGLTSDDPRVDAVVALHVARTAVPVASAERQNALAVSILSAERLLAQLEDRPVGTLSDASRRALDQVPAARARATRLVQDLGISTRGYRKHAAPATVRCAVRGAAEACIPDSDALLHEMLAGAIASCSRLVRRPERALDAQQWESACALTLR